MHHLDDGDHAMSSLDELAQPGGSDCMVEIG